MRHSCIIYAVVACCLLHLSSADPEKNGQAGTVAQHQRNDSSSALGNASQGESEIMAAARNASLTKTGLLFDENYATMLNGKPSADIDLMNDSAEVDDSIDEFKDFVLPRETTRPSVKKGQNFKNVYKVPKKVVKSAPTITSVLGQASLRSDRTINDFNPETFFPSENSNQSYFHAFSNLYDHFTWSASSFAFLDEPCMSDMNSYLDGLRRSLDWAVKASDASGRYRGLFFFDNDFWLGSKSCCYDINIEKRAIGQLEMKFFVVKILVKLPSTTTTRLLHIGQCLPKSCSSDDVSTIMSLDPAFLTLTKTTAQGEQNDLKLFEARAVPGEANIWKEKKLFVFGSIILTIFILIVIATCYENSLASQGFDMNENGQQEPRRKKSSLVGIKCGLKDTERHEMNHMNNNNEAEGESDKICEGHKLGFASKILLCFAYGSNSSVILSTKTNSEDSLSCIHGLRFFTLLWTIMVHTYLQMFAIGENRFIRKISERTFFYQIVGNATYSVDTFFFIGGLLVVLLFLKADKKKRQANENIPSNFWGASLRRTFVMIFYRFLRLTPVYVVIIVFTELTMKVMYNESVFTPGLSDHETCKEFWWRNVLYINNFFPLSQICLMWSWYLANDFQFYMVAIFLLILSRRYLKLSLFASVLLLLSSWLMSIYMSVHNKYTHKVSEPFESFDILYDKPWQRFGPYAMGMVAGYILNRVKVPPKVPLVVNLGLWVLSMFTLFIVVFGVPSGELSILMTSLYVSLGHTAWGLALMWPTLSCSWKLAQPINNFLSFNGFFPLSRLTYCTYLIHPTVMMITSFDCDGAMHLKHSMILTSFLGNSVISFLFAFVLSIMFEAPVIRLLKLCFR